MGMECSTNLKIKASVNNQKVGIKSVNGTNLTKGSKKTIYFYGSAAVNTLKLLAGEVFDISDS